MKWLVELALASMVLVLGSIGCTEQGDPAPFPSRSDVGANGSTTSVAGGCDASGVAAGSGKVDEVGAELARAQASFVDARDENDRIDHDLARHLSRVAMALTLEQQRAFIAAYEATEKVAKVRRAYVEKMVKLAGKLDEIDRSDDLARIASQTESTLLYSAYGLLARSACPARAVRFAGLVLAQTDGAPIRYPGLTDTNAKNYALMFIMDGAAGALVERAIETETEPAMVLGEVHAWLSRVNGPASALLNVIASKEKVLEASRAGQQILVFQQDALPVVKAIGTVLTVWGVAQDVAEGDLVGLVKSGPAGVTAVLEGTNALRRALGLEELLWASKAAVAAGKIAGGIGVLTAALATLDSLATMKDADDAIAAVGNALLLAGAVVALTGGSSAILVAAGTAAKILADILSTPPEDEVRPLLEALAANGVIPTESVDPLAHARNGSLRNLYADLGQPVEEVLWVVTRSPDAAAQGDGYRGLVQIGRVFGMTGAPMTSFVHGITDPADLAWQRWELFSFMGYVNLSESFQTDDAGMMRETLQHWATELETGDALAKEWGLPREQMTAHGRAVFAKALAMLP